MPSPWRRMTTPWKRWTRERLPSTTRTPTSSALQHAVVDALVAAAREGQPRLGAELLRQALGERLAGGGGDDQAGYGDRAAECVQRASPGLGLHDHPGTTPVG